MLSLIKIGVPITIDKIQKWITVCREVVLNKVMEIGAGTEDGPHFSLRSAPYKIR